MPSPLSDPWVPLGSEQGPELKIFRARFDNYRNPRNGKDLRATVLTAPEWANVVAITNENKFVLVEQFRFGIRRNTIEIPAGIVEPGEAPFMAAQRELREETGYSSDRWQSLGWVYPNPAFLSNRCHQWLALDAVQTGKPNLDDGENIRVIELTPEEIRREITEGRMRNALGLLALSRVVDMRFEWMES